ncbi:SesA domain-containing protein [Balamuthia mandrillaris]
MNAGALPTELWIAVFSRVTSLRDLHHASLACRDFYALCWDESICRAAYRSLFNEERKPIHTTWREALFATGKELVQLRRDIFRHDPRKNSLLFTYEECYWAVSNGLLRHLEHCWFSTTKALRKRLLKEPAYLHEACDKGHLNVVRFLLDNDMSPSIHNEQWQSPIFEASSHGHAEVVKELILRGGVVWETDTAGNTPIIAAAKNGHLPVLQLLVEHVTASGITLRKAVDKKEKDNGRTALWWAACNGHREVAEYLLKQGANPALKDFDGRTASQAAIDYGHHKLARDCFHATIPEGAAVQQANNEQPLRRSKRRRIES